MLWLLMEHTTSRVARAKSELEWNIALKLAALHGLYAPFFVRRTVAFFDTGDTDPPVGAANQDIVAQTQVV